MNMKESIPPTTIKKLEQLIDCLGSETTNIRLCLSQLVPIAYTFRGFYDIYTEDPDVMFFSYIVVDWFANVQSSYDGRSDQWYELNNQNVQQMRAALKTYCQGILNAINSNDLNTLIIATKSFMGNFHNLARTTTNERRGQT
jgi:hypothetical protein